MKKKIAVMAMIMAMTGSFTGVSAMEMPAEMPAEMAAAMAGDSEETEMEEEDYVPFTLEEDEEKEVLTYLDLEYSPIADCGLKTEVKAGEEGYVLFTKTDLEGNETVEYYKFLPAEHIMEKYTYVSAMGTGFYYTYDLEKEELVKIEDMNHEDSTESTKEAGRFDSAQEKIQTEAKKLQKYFEGHYEMTMEESVGIAEEAVEEENADTEKAE